MFTSEENMRLIDKSVQYMFEDMSGTMSCEQNIKPTDKVIQI